MCGLIRALYVICMCTVDAAEDIKREHELARALARPLTPINALNLARRFLERDNALEALSQALSFVQMLQKLSLFSSPFLFAFSLCLLSHTICSRPASTARKTHPPSLSQPLRLTLARCFQVYRRTDANSARLRLTAENLSLFKFTRQKGLTFFISFC